MKMSDYLAGIEHAVSSLVPLVIDERSKLREMEEQLKALEATVVANYRQAEFVQMNADDMDEFMMGVGMHWDNYFGPDKAHHVANKEMDRLVEQIASRSDSIVALAGSLLEFAKQAIARVYGSPKKCPPGRDVRGTPLRDVVWQGRNQHTHWMEGKLSQPVRDCFDALAANIDLKFAEYHNRSLSVDVVDLLEWHSFDAFQSDLLVLG